MDAGVVVGFKTPGNVWCSGDELTSGWHRIRDRDRTTPDSQLAYLIKVRNSQADMWCRSSICIRMYDLIISRNSTIAYRSFDDQLSPNIH